MWSVQHLALHLLCDLWLVHPVPGCSSSMKISPNLKSRLKMLIANQKCWTKEGKNGQHTDVITETVGWFHWRKFYHKNLIRNALMFCSWIYILHLLETKMNALIFPPLQRSTILVCEIVWESSCFVPRACNSVFWLEPFYTAATHFIGLDMLFVGICSHYGTECKKHNASVNVCLCS